jgi:hypothetical protein
VGLAALMTVGLPTLDARAFSQSAVSDSAFDSRPVHVDSRLSVLSVTLIARPTRATVGSAVRFTLTVADNHTIGALGYAVKFGDGTTRTIVVPEYCIAPPGRPGRATWSFSHRYSKPGRYRVSAFAYMNCSSMRGTKAVSLTIT